LLDILRRGWAENTVALTLSLADHCAVYRNAGPLHVPVNTARVLCSPTGVGKSTLYDTAGAINGLPQGSSLLVCPRSQHLNSALRDLSVCREVRGALCHVLGGREGSMMIGNALRGYALRKDDPWPADAQKSSAMADELMEVSEPRSAASLSSLPKGMLGPMTYTTEESFYDYDVVRKVAGLVGRLIQNMLGPTTHRLSPEQLAVTVAILQRHLPHMQARSICRSSAASLAESRAVPP